MINIQTLATGSSGNCYRVDDGNTALLLEAGISFANIQKKLNFKTSEIAGVLVTHEHKDHCKGVRECLKRGMTIYTSQGTKDGMGVDSAQIRIIKSRQAFRIGTWSILPFDVQHDVNEPLGFLLQSDNGDKLLFATDTYYIKYKFQGLKYIMVECNYDEETLNYNAENGLINPALRKRVLKSHFGLKNVLEFLKSNDLSKVEEIHLLHLSDGNSNKERIFTEVARTTGKAIIIP